MGYVNKSNLDDDDEIKILMKRHYLSTSIIKPQYSNPYVVGSYVDKMVGDTALLIFNHP